MEESNVALEAQVERLKQENEDLRRRIKESMTVGLVEGFAYHSDTFDVNRQDFIALTGLRFRGDSFFVAFLQPREENQRIIKIDSALNITEKPEYSFVDMRRIIENSFSDKHILLTIPSHKDVICIINYQRAVGEGEEAAEGEIEAVMESINQSTKRSYGFMYDIFVSRMQTGAKNVCKATQDCELLKEYSQMLEDSSPKVLFYSWFQRLTNAENANVINAENLQFSRSVSNNDYAAARELLKRRIIPRMVEASSMSLTLRLEYYRLADFFIRIVLDRVTVPAGKRQKCVEALLRSETFAELNAVMEDMLSWLEQHSSLKHLRTEDLAEKLHSYIDSYYAQPGVDVNSVAGHFSVSPSYASKIHKARYGSTLLAWLQQRRVQAADEMLRQGIPVKIIAENTGFVSSANLIRIFKKYHGITPGQFSLCDTVGDVRESNG